MKEVKALLRMAVFSLCLATTVSAGEILTPGITPPPPPSPAQSSVAGAAGSVQGSSELSIFDALFSGTVSIIQWVGLLLP